MESIDLLMAQWALNDAFNRLGVALFIWLADDLESHLKQKGYIFNPLSGEVLAVRS